MPVTQRKGGDGKKSPSKPRSRAPNRKPDAAKAAPAPAAPDPDPQAAVAECVCYACRQHRHALEWEKLPASRKGAPGADPVHRNGVRFEPTPAERQLVMLMAAGGFTVEQAATQIRLMDGGLCLPTFAKHFREEWSTGGAAVNLRVINNLFTIATTPTHKSSAAAAMFWAKTRMRWAENPLQAVEIERLNKLAAEAERKDAEGPPVIALQMSG